MALLQFGPVTFDTGLLALDKDGTLIDFAFAWGRLAVVWVERLAAGDEALARDLYRSIGFDPLGQRTDPQGPLAIATTAQIRAIAMGALYRHGLPWPAAEDRARAAFDTEADYPLASLIRPTGDVVGLLEQVRQAGVRVVVVTTDHRPETEVTLAALGITHLVDWTVCGDDGLPSKPAPDMLLAACRHLDIEPGRTAVVGDTLGDLLMARRAGAGLRVAVLSGTGGRDLLAGHADVVLESIDDIGVGGDSSLAGARSE